MTNPEDMGPGYYWVKFCGEWTVGEYDPGSHYPWTLVGSDEIYMEWDMEEIGERVERREREEREGMKKPDLNKPAFALFPEMKQKIEQGLCSWCGKPVGEFRDELSQHEYGISGFCQQCQDETFEEVKDEGEG